MPVIRVLLVDDHAILRTALRYLLDESPGIEIVGEAGDGREAIERIAQLRPQLVLMDITMPNLGGIEATRIIRTDHPDIHVVMLSMHKHEDYVIAALRAGAAGYIYKGSSPQEIELAIESVVSGQHFLSPIVLQPVVEAYLGRRIEQQDVGALDQLTSRQRQILQLVVEGRSSKEIAEMLDMSVRAIDAHRATIMERLGIRNLPGLVRYAIRHGLISAEE